MARHLHREIERLKGRLLTLCTVVEESLRGAVRAAEKSDAALAESVIKGDAEIDRLEVDLEEDCLKVLALYQPVANDLRFIIAVLKINNDLERVGDLATNMADRAIDLSTRPRIAAPLDIHGMGEKVQWMLKTSIDSFVNEDVDLAHQVLAADDQVDEIHKATFVRVQEEIHAHPENLETLINHLSLSRYLERIADHATNIAEDVIYLSEGEIIRHRRKEFQIAARRRQK